MSASTDAPAPHETSTPSTQSEPYHIAVALFPGFELLDVAGPLEMINILNYQHPIELSLLSETLEPVSTKIASSTSRCYQSLVPTHTYAAPPEKINLLIVPGGPGTRAPPPQVIPFITSIYPTLDNLLTICTGAALVAQTGILNGRKATSNKRAWDWVISQGPQVEWIKEARWVVDGEGKGQIWSSAGVAAGMDATLAWIGSRYGEEVAATIAHNVEYEWHRDSSFDPALTY